MCKTFVICFIHDSSWTFKWTLDVPLVFCLLKDKNRRRILVISIQLFPAEFTLKNKKSVFSGVQNRTVTIRNSILKIWQTIK